jgi:hypothetical protein
MPVTPDQFYDAVGRVVVEAARMEAQLGDLVAAAGGGLTIYLTRGQSFGVLEQMLKSLLRNEHLEAPLREQISAALVEAGELQKKRDAIVHGLWIADDAGRRIAHKPKRYTLAGVPHAFSTDELLELAHSLATSAARLFHLTWNVNSIASGMAPMDIPSDLRDRVVSGHRDTSTEEPQPGGES